VKIVQVCPRYYPYIGGLESHVENISKRLAKKYEVSVFTTYSSGKLPRKEEIKGVSVRRFRCFAPSEAYHFSLGLLKELKKVKFDVVHGHAFHAFPLFFSRYAQRQKYVVTPHYHGIGHTAFRNFLLKLYKPIGKKALEEADKIICVSNYERACLLNDFRSEEKKVVVIPNGVDMEEFKNLKKERSHLKRILYVGRIEKFKGIDYLIRSLPKLDHDVLLEIIGKGGYEKQLVKLVDEMGLKNRVIFQQNLSRTKLLERYAKADLFAYLSKYEAFGISVAEALASKIPCIVANSLALKEWIDNENCFGVKYPINVNELVSLIDKVIGKEVEGVKLLDWDDVVVELIKVYEDY